MRHPIIYRFVGIQYHVFLSCEDMYRLLVYKTAIPKSQIKWNQVFQNMDMNWKSVYTVTKICCRNTKLYWFQYRLLHRILAIKYRLTKMNIEQNNLCTFCGEEVEKLEHFFWQCNTVNTFWENIEQWIYDQNNYLTWIDIFTKSLNPPKL